jgi:hypothetical protein
VHGDYCEDVGMKIEQLVGNIVHEEEPEIPGA